MNLNTGVTVLILVWPVPFFGWDGNSGLGRVVQGNVMPRALRTAPMNDPVQT